jgi:hypothetical protein
VSFRPHGASSLRPNSFHRPEFRRCGHPAPRIRLPRGWTASAAIPGHAIRPIFPPLTSCGGQCLSSYIDLHSSATYSVRVRACHSDKHVDRPRRKSSVDADFYGERTYQIAK